MNSISGYDTLTTSVSVTQFLRLRKLKRQLSQRDKGDVHVSDYTCAFPPCLILIRPKRERLRDNSISVLQRAAANAVIYYNKL